ncbi:MAG: hypothetical protein QXU11_10625 [Thermoproteota archaeon]
MRIVEPGVLITMPAPPMLQATAESCSTLVLSISSRRSLPHWLILNHCFKRFGTSI